MKLLLVTTDYPPARGGVARYYGQLVSALGSSATALVPHGSAWLTWISQVARQVREARADLLWVGQVLPVGTVAFVLRCLGGKPYIVSTHGTDLLAPQRSLRKRWLARAILHRAVLVTANSSYTAGLLAKLYNVPGEKIVAIHPAPADLPTMHPSGESFRARLGIPQSAPIVLAVGRLVERKGFSQLILAMQRIWEEQPDARCVILGSGPEHAALVALAEEVGSSRIHIDENFDDAALPSAYSAASVLALPGTQTGADVEGFGIVCLEASAAGLPVVATRVGGVPEAVQEGVSGLLVEPGDTEALAAAICKLLGDRDLHRRMSASGPAWAAKFSWSASASKLAAAAAGTI